MTKILLLGGGNVLSLLAKKLQQEGTKNAQFVITSRRQEQVNLFRAAGFTAEQLDILNYSALQDFFVKYSDLEIIIDSVPPIFANQSSSLDDSLVGVRNLVSVLKDYPLKRLIYLSTTGVYGAVNGEVVSEDSPIKPLSDRGQARFKSEELYRQNIVNFCALRIAGITSNQHNPRTSLIRGSYPLIENGERYSNRIHIEDLVEVIFKSLNLNQELPRAINVADGAPLKTKDLIIALQSKYNFPYPTSISYEDAKALGMHTLLGNQQVSNQLLINTFGDFIRYKGVDWMIEN